MLSPMMFLEADGYLRAMQMSSEFPQCSFHEAPCQGAWVGCGFCVTGLSGPESPPCRDEAFDENKNKPPFCVHGRWEIGCTQRHPPVWFLFESKTPVGRLCLPMGAQEHRLQDLKSRIFTHLSAQRGQTMLSPDKSCFAPTEGTADKLLSESYVPFGSSHPWCENIHSERSSQFAARLHLN